ncbi:hypothetical protein ABZ621_02695 [Streptomyces sp. NPDC007863]|uniref:hypothetical protein n=1 Tax=Streptomyces sp. NPDC007863 TaxID=3154894 RepID=UPI0033FE39A6
MRTRNGATLLAAALLAAGCGSRGDAPAFGREAARAEIRTAVVGAGLPESELPGPGEATGTAAPGTERERVAVRAAGCSAGWQYVGPAVDGSLGKYDEALTALAGKGWTESGERKALPVGEGDGPLTQVVLKKDGWTLYARHMPSRTLGADTVSFNATEDACMEQFTEREIDLLSGEEAGH